MSSSTQFIDLSTMSPAARRLIVIYPDRDAASRRAEEARSIRLSEFTRTAGRTARKLYFGPIVSIPVDRLVDKLANKMKGPPVLAVTHGEVHRAQLKFPPGHPIERTVYGANPVDPGTYFPVSTYHHMVFEHKFAEALRLLIALGATNIVVEHEQGWSHELASNLQVHVPEDEAAIGLSANGETAARSKVLFEARFKAAREPQLPENLDWYAHEELWKTMAQARLLAGLESFQLKLDYTDDRQIDAKLVGRCKDAGMEIGGAFQGHTNTSWSIRGDFGTPGGNPRA